MGPETLLSIGQEIRNISYDPIWHAAIRSTNPALLFDKWRRFEVFAHSQNRLKINQTCEKRILFQRYTVDKGTPTAPENLLICGLIIALLKEIGCLDLSCEMLLTNGEHYTIFEAGHFSTPEKTDALVTDAWTIEWQSFSPKADNAPLEAELPNITLPEASGLSLKTTIETVIQHLINDIARHWKVGELAREAGLSKRSLQRKLHDANLSFSSIVRLVRIHEACRLLKDSKAPITAIGFCTGFSDSAHFSRDFRASMGMTPSDYRSIS